MNLVEPYLNFSGRTEEALKFYQETLGAEVLHCMRFSDAPDTPMEGEMPPGFENKILHCLFKIGGSQLMASDGCGEREEISGISLAISVSSPEEADEKFEALSQGGVITMPIGETFFSPRFGMVKDRFGVHWMVGYHPEPAAS